MQTMFTVSGTGCVQKRAAMFLMKSRALLPIIEQSSKANPTPLSCFIFLFEIVYPETAKCNYSWGSLIEETLLSKQTNRATMQPQFHSIPILSPFGVL